MYRRTSVRLSRRTASQCIAVKPCIGWDTINLMEHRPDPDDLLKNLQTEEHGRGKLKIFLGYAAGVGKTYAMLEAAHQRKMQGIDVLVGYVETHKRVETEELVEGLEVLPRQQVE